MYPKVDTRVKNKHLEISFALLKERIISISGGKRKSVSDIIKLIKGGLLL